MEGGWWKRYRPDQFTYHDIDLDKGDGVDFTALPEPDNAYDAVCFDPPYVASGGISKTHGGFQASYGIGSILNNASAGELDRMINVGISEAARVARQWLLVKCMEFAGGGSVFVDMPFKVTQWALDVGLTKHDQIVHQIGRAHV